MSFGGLTGYAINPARDFMPRFVHAIMPIKNKGSSNFDYAWGSCLEACNWRNISCLVIQSIVLVLMWGKIRM